jgi:hypothetical protein
MKRLTLLALLAGCPANVTIYRSLSEPGAMQTCDANTRFRAEAQGAAADDARLNVELEIKKTIQEQKGCGALIFNEGSGKTLDGNVKHVADFQLCRCQ